MRYLLALICFAIPVIVSAQEEGDWVSYFSIVGRINGILSKQFIASSQEQEGRQWIWANARLGKREHATGKTRTSQNEFRTEMVPTDFGIVIVLNPPNPHPSAAAWMPWHDPDSHTFQFTVPTGDKLKTCIIGYYGPAFPKETLTEILKLAGRELSDNPLKGGFKK